MWRTWSSNTKNKEIKVTSNTIVQGFSKAMQFHETSFPAFVTAAQLHKRKKERGEEGRERRKSPLKFQSLYGIIYDVSHHI